MKKPDIIKIMDLFDSILVQCVEGVEFYTRTELAEIIRKEAKAGIGICKNALQPAVEADAEKPCRRCQPGHGSIENYCSLCGRYLRTA